MGNASLEAAEALGPDIRAFVAAYEDAPNTHDPTAVSAFYRNDPEIIVRSSPSILGLQAIQDWWHGYFSEPRPYRAILIIDEIRMIAPNVALINIIATGSATQSEGQRMPVRHARATWVVVRESGGWLISALWVLPSEETGSYGVVVVHIEDGSIEWQEPHNSNAFQGAVPQLREGTTFRSTARNSETVVSHRR